METKKKTVQTGQDKDSLSFSSALRDTAYSPALWREESSTDRQTDSRSRRHEV